MKRVLVVGEINVDLVLQGAHAFPIPGKEVVVDDVVMTLGSASAICAMGLARLGTPVAFLGKVGTDPWGEFCVDVMRTAGIDVSRVTADPKLKTGVTVSITSPH
ncbi:MAG TPA: carbohydrate kinase family protein, partial [Vicinamibacteria bacterium]|nr:carbohydrate kinase family protein [Vicinamibacteria bacterium]